MKQTIANFLIHILSYLVPIEHVVNGIIAKAASSKMAQEAEAELSAAYKAAASIQAQASAAYQARLSAAKKVAPVVTPEGAAALVSAAASSQPAALPGS
jgi:hypothetical protein